MFDWMQHRVISRVKASFSEQRSKPAYVYPDQPPAGVYFDGEQPSAFLYQYGFVACIKGVADDALDRLEPIAGWRKRNWSDWIIAMHPGAQLTTSNEGGNTLAIIGEVFDPFNKVFDSQSIADTLCSYSNDETGFLERLDDLSGRFVVLVKHDSDWLVYNDAFSSRAIFYHAHKAGIIASHAALLADVCADMVDFNVLAFTQTDAYKKRDVKHLPGCRTLYRNIHFCVANHRLNMSCALTERYWPRPGVLKPSDPSATLIRYLDGYGDYIRSRYDREIFGLTGGMDSRTLLAALSAKEMPMTTFTIFRGDQAGGNAKDAAMAKELSAHLGFDHEQINIDYQKLNPEYYSELLQVLRRNAGFVRLNSAFSQVKLCEHFKDRYPGESCSYSRGFGGEILRGFYQGRLGEIQKASAGDFAKAYGLQPGSPFVQASFAHYIASSDFNELQGMDINDIFYWEHRMSTWGALAVVETDITACTYIGYNSRRLFQSFMSQPFSERTKRIAFRDAINHFKPDLLDFDIA